jgi:hypothetical protein
MHTFNVFTAHHSPSQWVPAHLFVAQVDAVDSQRACDAVAESIGMPVGYFSSALLSAQFADDPRASGQRHATDAEIKHLVAYCTSFETI